MKKQTAVTEQTTERAADLIQRCAVCKIDLRGRFVYADAEFEQLIGLSQDELFGHPLIDYTAESDHEAVNRLLVQHSQYESIHEAARIRLIDHSGAERPVAMIAALNFVAGNAVNFQVVFHTLSGSESMPVAATSRHPFESLLTAAGSYSEHIPWDSMVCPLQEMSRAKECLVYRIDGDTLIQLATSADPAGGLNAVSLVGPTDDFHWWLSQSGERYRFDYPDNVRAALEGVAEAPTELIVPVTTFSDEKFLVRCVYDGVAESESGRVASAMDQVESFLRLLSAKAPSIPAAQGAVATGGDLASTADLLAVGACELRSDNSIGEINHTLAAYIRFKAAPSLTEFLAAVTSECDTIGRKMITDAIGICRASAQPTSCSVRLTGPDESVGHLTVLRLEAAPDSSLWLCQLPGRPGSLGAAVARPAILQLLETVHRLLNVATDSAAPLAHAVFAEAPTAQKLQLVALTDSLQQAERLITELQQVSSMAGRPRKLQEVNLNMLVGQIFERLRRETEGGKINLACGELPVIRSACAELETALFCIARTIVGDGRQDECRIQIGAEISDGACVITCGDLSGEQSRSLLEQLEGAVGATDNHRLHDQLALAVALDTLQGQLESVAGNPRSIRLILPR